jgi:hypothetical protein
MKQSWDGNQYLRENIADGPKNVKVSLRDKAEIQEWANGRGVPALCVCDPSQRPIWSGIFVDSSAWVCNNTVSIEEIASRFLPVERSCFREDVVGFFCPALNA